MTSDVMSSQFTTGSGGMEFRGTSAEVEQTSSFTDPSPARRSPSRSLRRLMRDESAIRIRLEQLRGQFLQWGTPELQVFVTTKEEMRGWIRALEWVLGKP